MVYEGEKAWCGLVVLLKEGVCSAQGLHWGREEIRQRQAEGRKLRRSKCPLA